MNINETIKVTDMFIDSSEPIWYLERSDWKIIYRRVQTKQNKQKKS